jgi:hypothetical protein
MPVEVTLHNKTIDSMLTTFWHVEQLHRIAEGREPDPRLSRIGAFLRGLVKPLGMRVKR